MKIIEITRNEIEEKTNEEFKSWFIELKNKIKEWMKTNVATNIAEKKAI